MIDATNRIARTNELTVEVFRGYGARTRAATQRLGQRVQEAFDEHLGDLLTMPAGTWPWQVWMDGLAYGIDFAQRAVLFWDTLRRRGNNYLDHEKAGKPAVLHFPYEVVLDARKFDKPVNYALLRIIPPKDVRVDPMRRPYVVIDPRAGHGPGIGGSKKDSQVGVALRAGHPVYFVTFFPEPEPGQTLLDVCEAEKRFIRKVRRLHPSSPKPAIVGNCQAGWAAMMLAASDPDDSGPIVLTGSPMSYWGGAWREGDGDNPMRYSAGPLGGTWMASLAADLGGGLFDGAHLVQNFENLNPANTFWDKYYHLFANIDTEQARFLDFERWWGGFFLMNREEIEWIVRHLFVGNDLWSGEVRSGAGKAFDPREIRSPIILFASFGDNITPPQQAFNWVADVYGSTEELKARGQTIVGLVQEEAGHLGIFVSGSVAKREHAGIVSVLKSIESLPPGLYEMKILDVRSPGGETTHQVEFLEHRLEEVIARLNRYHRMDEKPFRVVDAVSELNQRAYELFAQPLVQALTNAAAAKLGRDFHPLRVQRWALSDVNPWLAWLRTGAEQVRANRRPVSAEQPFRRAERVFSEVVSATLDYGRAMRDAASEALFFLTYGSLFFACLADKLETAKPPAEAPDPRTLPSVQEALAAVAQGGYPEALARAGALLTWRGQPIPLARLELKAGLEAEYKNLLPDLSPEKVRRVCGEQELIVQYEPERALATLPALLGDPNDRERFLTLIDRVLTDERVLHEKPSPEQFAMAEEIRKALSREPANGAGTARKRPRAATKAAKKALKVQP